MTICGPLVSTSCGCPFWLTISQPQLQLFGHVVVGGKKGGLPVTVGLNVGLFVGLNVTGLKWKIHIFFRKLLLLLFKRAKWGPSSGRSFLVHGYSNTTYLDFSACNLVQCVQFVIVIVADRNVGRSQKKL